jgi:hypothetical protein
MADTLLLSEAVRARGAEVAVAVVRTFSEPLRNGGALFDGD